METVRLVISVSDIDYKYRRSNDQQIPVQTTYSIENMMTLLNFHKYQ